MIDPERINVMLDRLLPGVIRGSLDSFSRMPAEHIGYRLPASFWIGVVALAGMLCVYRAISRTNARQGADEQ